MPDLAQYVDPFVGIDNGGNCLCGPSLPHSLVRLGPDTTIPHNNNGYKSNADIIRFSHTHVAGTGGAGRYGNVGVAPFIGSLTDTHAPYKKVNEYAEPGYYKTTLDPQGIVAELTSTPRVGVHRYTFPSDHRNGIWIDAGSVIQTTCNRLPHDSSRSIGGFLERLSGTEVFGRSDFQGGWGHAHSYSVYFYALFDTPCMASQLYNTEGMQNLFSNYCIRTGERNATEGPRCIVALSFDANVVNVRVGISFVSVAKARASVERETVGKTFEDIRARAKSIWHTTLSQIRIEGGTEKDIRLFYTMFYRLRCMPGDLGVDDEFPLWHSGVRHFNDMYCLWDSVRNANSLVALIDPDYHVDLLNCVLDIGEHTGWLPDAWVAFHHAFAQGGSTADVLFCEAALKGLGGIDYEKALKLMRKNGEEVSPDPYLYGRYGNDAPDLGYVPVEAGLNCVSHHIEYSYQDWCTAQLARKLGYDSLAAQYEAKSHNVWNLWRDDLQCFAPRRRDGTFIDPFDPTRKGKHGFMDPYFYEASAVQWMWNVQHDFGGLVQRLGGKEKFVIALDRFFDQGHYHSKEILLHIPYLYNYAGRNDKTCLRVRKLLKRHFSLTRDGLTDNEDMGVQSAWFMLSSMGMYPIMGQDIYQLCAPVFRESEIKLGNSGKSIVIEANPTGSPNEILDTVTLNGKPLGRCWLKHSEIADGARIKIGLKKADARLIQ